MKEPSEKPSILKQTSQFDLNKRKEVKQLFKNESEEAKVLE